MSRPIASPPNLIRPSENTRYHIDYDWWDRSGQDLHLYLLGHLCETHRSEFSGVTDSGERIEWIDPVTGQVLLVDGLTYTFMTHCSQQADFVSERTSMVDAVFRVLLASGNRPMTPKELSEITGRPSEMILKTLSGKTIYKGLRPASDA